MSRKKVDGPMQTPMFGSAGSLAPANNIQVSLLDRFPQSVNPIPFDLIGAVDSTEIAAERATLLQQRQDLLNRYSALVRENGLRPVLPSSALHDEERYKITSSWHALLQEASWMANDFGQERLDRAAAHRVIAAELMERRMSRPPTKSAKAIESFWSIYGGEMDGRQLPPFLSLPSVSKAMDIQPTEVILRREEDGIANMTSNERLNALLRLDRTSELRSTQGSLISRHPDFEGTLSPIQSTSLRRLGVIGRHGLGCVLCESGENEHRLTVAAFLARLRGDLSLEGPYLICGMTARDVAYCRGYIAQFCPQFKIVCPPVNSTSIASGTYGKNEVVCFHLKSDSPVDIIKGDAWSAIALIVDEATMAIKTEPNLWFKMPKPRWGGPVVVINQNESVLLEKNALFHFVAHVLGIAPKRLREVLATPPAEAFTDEFALMECIVACAETDNQRQKRLEARSDPALQETAAAHSNLASASAHAATWRWDSVPPPQRPVLPAKMHTVDVRSSGKFESALSLLRSGRCRRALVLSARRKVLDAFMCFCAPHLTTFQFYHGTLDARVASWIRFLKSTDGSCMLSTFEALEDAPGKGLNSTVDAVLLLDVFSTEQSVSTLKAVCNHALVYRLYTRGETIEQQALQSTSHPCVMPQSASNPIPPDKCELRTIPRPFELDTAKETESLEIENQMRTLTMERMESNTRFRSLQQYAFLFSLGETGTSTFASTFAASKGETSSASIKSTASKNPALSIPKPESLSFGKTIPGMDRLYYDVRTLPKNRIAFNNHVENQVNADQQEGAASKPLLVVSMLEKKSGSMKKRRATDVEMNGGMFALPDATGGGINPNAIAPQMSLLQQLENAGLSFSLEEDAFIKAMMHAGQVSAAYVAELLNAERFARRLPVNGTPPPMRTAKEVAERMAWLQRQAERRDKMFIMDLDAESETNTFKEVIGNRMQMWGREIDEPYKKQYPHHDTLSSASASAEKRLNPLQILVPQKQQQQAAAGGQQTGSQSQAASGAVAVASQSGASAVS